MASGKPAMARSDQNVRLDACSGIRSGFRSLLLQVLQLHYLSCIPSLCDCEGNLWVGHRSDKAGPVKVLVIVNEAVRGKLDIIPASICNIEVAAAGDAICIAPISADFFVRTGFVQVNVEIQTVSGNVFLGCGIINSAARLNPNRTAVCCERQVGDVVSRIEVKCAVGTHGVVTSCAAFCGGQRPLVRCPTAAVRS